MAHRNSWSIHRTWWCSVVMVSWQKYWLVVGPPLWKIWVRQLGWLDTQYMAKIRNDNKPPTRKLLSNQNGTDQQKLGIVTSKRKRVSYFTAVQSTVRKIQLQLGAPIVRVLKKNQKIWGTPSKSMITHRLHVCHILFAIYHQQKPPMLASIYHTYGSVMGNGYGMGYEQNSGWSTIVFFYHSYWAVKILWDQWGDDGNPSWDYGDIVGVDNPIIFPSYS